MEEEFEDIFEELEEELVEEEEEPKTEEVKVDTKSTSTEEVEEVELEPEPEMEITNEEVEEKAEEVEVTPLVESAEEFEFADEETPPIELVPEQEAPTKIIVLIAGDKGHGKTYTALSLGGHILALSFDRKTSIIKSQFYPNEEIRVYDVAKYIDYSSPEQILNTAMSVYKGLIKLLDTYERKYGKPDWVVIDNAELYTQFVEYVMRKRHGLGLLQGVRNLNIWKDRRNIMRAIHNKALDLARKGIVYTTYLEDETVIVEGDVVSKNKVPVWLDIIKTSTDIVLLVNKVRGRGFTLSVYDSKLKDIPVGAEYDFTDKKLPELFPNVFGGGK